MAPPRKILRQQLEILIEFIEEHKELAKGRTPAAPASHQDTRQKWVELAKTLNLVPKGALKTPDGWKKVERFKELIHYMLTGYFCCCKVGELKQLH